MWRFTSEIFNKLGDIDKILKFLRGTFWDKLLITKKQFDDFKEGKHLKRWQQEGADLVLFYGEDLLKEPNKVILLNVKSHESSRKSRDPNIMSAQRLIEYINDLIGRIDGKNLLDNAELWFIGVNYLATEKGGKITGIFVKDLFKLDVSLIPQINFDAAIQIQWHVENMKEIEQSNKEFAIKLLDEFIIRWEKHSKHKDSKYKILAKSIKSKLT
ncbi:MAG: HincII family type II restriction endonuclease [Nanoarchaeota archaeon]